MTARRIADFNAVPRGDFAAALKLYRKAVPFPGIISHICDQPCQAACLRKELGGAIEIAALERACLEFGRHGAEPIKPLPRKAKKVAVIGAGISGLTVAFDLARKGWGVSIYEASDRIGGGLWKTPPDLLPRDILLNDLRVIEDLGVEVILKSPIGRKGGRVRFLADSGNQAVTGQRHALARRFGAATAALVRRA